MEKFLLNSVEFAFGIMKTISISILKQFQCRRVKSSRRKSVEICKITSEAGLKSENSYTYFEKKKIERNYVNSKYLYLKEILDFKI